MAYRIPEVEQLRAQVAALTERVRRLEDAAGLLPPEPAPAPPDPVAPETPGALPLAAPPRPGARFRLRPADGMSLESRIGSHWLNRIGIVATLIGVSYFLRYAFENEWIGPAGRVAIGLVGGMAILLGSERFRVRGYLPFSWSMKALGVGMLYLSIWAAVQLYQLVPPQVGFGAMAAVTASTAILALRQDAIVLGAFALLGGYATPVLLSTGENRPVELFAYVALLNAGMLGMVRYRPWVLLAAGGFLGTTVLYVGWHAAHYTAADRMVALAFASLFFGMFAAVPLLARYPPGGAHDPAARDTAWRTLGMPVLLLLPLANAGVYFLQLLALTEPLGRNVPPSAALVLAAAYLALGRLVRAREGPRAVAPALAGMHAAAAIALVTIAIPLRLDAHWMTIGWLVEAAALLWVGARGRSRLVGTFGVAALALGVLRLLLIDDFRTDLVLLNQRFLTFGLAISILAAVAWLGRRSGQLSARAQAVATIALNVLALVALSREVQAGFHPAQASAPLVTGTASAAREFTYSAVWMGYGALVVLAGFALRWTLLRWQALVILGVTVVKVFVYDLSTLDPGYRILSFIVLGVLLMAISFAYQRDWLRLREEHVRPTGVGEA
jgi:uncharacterized membrane protein